MGRVELKPGRSSRAVMRRIAHSDEIAAFLRPIAASVLSAASRDSNDRYVANLSIREHHSRGALGRVSSRVGCDIPELGRRVEAERGTLARALGASGA